MKKDFIIRIRIISLFVLLAAFVLIAKLYDLQIINGSAYSQKADRQYVQPSQGVFDRGSIFFKDKSGGLISAATLKSGFILTVNPKVLLAASSSPKGNSEYVYTQIFNIINAPGTSTEESFSTLIDKNTFIARATKPNDTYEEIGKHISEDQGNAISALKLPGVGLYQDKWRYYPGNSTAAHALGFLGYKGNDYAGRYGLESFYDSTLDRSSDNLYVNFFAEIFSGIHKVVSDQSSIEGDVVTSIEPTTQSYLEDVLEKVTKQYSSEASGGIIMDPKTGEIYAMAYYPTFDPNNLSDQKNSAIFSNDLVEHVHEMGSIIKPLTMATGIDVGVVNAKTTYNDTASVTLNGKTIYNFDKKGRGQITLQYAMGQSLNVGFVYVEQKIGNKVFGDYFNKYFGTKTSVDLPNEATDLISNMLNSPRDIEHATAAFGQGISMTPIATIRALASIANGGYLVTPHVATAINYKIGVTKTLSYPPGPTVMKQSTAEAVTAMLVDDVDKVMAGGKAKNPNYSVAAKTGTAQIPDPTGGYYPDRYLHSFVGYLPAYNPKFIVLLYTIYPKGVKYSSETLVNPFLAMTKFLINYYQLPPDR